VTTNIAIFALAAFFEIAGCFAFWLWVRRGAAPVVVLLGTASLIGFALALARINSAFAGRAYAAYGGIYIAASLVWLWVVEDQTPTRTDVVVAVLAVLGALVIIAFAARARWAISRPRRSSARWDCPHDCPCDAAKRPILSQRQPSRSIAEVFETVGKTKLVERRISVSKPLHRPIFEAVSSISIQQD
jgi:small multidrug resistance family-3 protein